MCPSNSTEPALLYEMWRSTNSKLLTGKIFYLYFFSVSTAVAFLFILVSVYRCVSVYTCTCAIRFETVKRIKYTYVHNTQSQVHARMQTLAVLRAHTHNVSFGSHRMFVCAYVHVCLCACVRVRLCVSAKEREGEITRILSQYEQLSHTYLCSQCDEQLKRVRCGVHRFGHANVL